MALFITFLFLGAKAQNCNFLVWSDEFNVNGAPDPTKWTYDTGYGIANSEVETYTTSINNSYVKDGILYIVALKDDAGNWTSARLKTQGLETFTYGRIEFRAIGPVGDGTWPALWLLGNDISSIGWPACGEIDVMEEVGKAPNVNHESIHTPSSYGNTVNTFFETIPTFSTAFHTYAIDWTPDSITFSVDSVNEYTYSPSSQSAATWPFSNPCFLIMNIAMGGTWGSDANLATNGLYNGIDPNISSATMQVDYVRVYSHVTPAISGDSLLYSGSTGVFTVPNMASTTFNWTVPQGWTVLSGQGTDTLRVQAGSNSGNVTVSITQSCGSATTNPFHVTVKQKPSAVSYDIPNADSLGNILWNIVPSTGNSFELAYDSSLEVSYDITEPNNIPYIEHPLGLIDFSNFSYISLTVKTEVNNPPPALRLDLIDNLGRNNNNLVFSMLNFPNDTLFHTYTGSIASSSSFDLTNIENMYLYMDYGFYGSASSDNFWIKDVVLSQTAPAADPVVYGSKVPYQIYPNPVHDVLYIHPFSDIIASYIVGMSGDKYSCILTSSGSIDVQTLAPGMYCLLLVDKSNTTYCLKFLKIG